MKALLTVLSLTYALDVASVAPADSCRLCRDSYQAASRTTQRKRARTSWISAKNTAGDPCKVVRKTRLASREVALITGGGP